MGQNEHTPTPWEDGTGDNGNDAWVFARGAAVADCDLYSDRDRNKANAEFIIRAANCHDELLAALKWFIDDIDGTHTVMLDFDANVKRARAALAKAQPASEGE
jgi:hypothetical protein